MVRSSAGTDTGIEVGREVLPRQADDEVLQVGQLAGSQGERRFARRRGIERIVPAHRQPSTAAASATLLPKTEMQSSDDPKATRP